MEKKGRFCSWQLFLFTNYSFPLWADPQVFRCSRREIVR